MIVSSRIFHCFFYNLDYYSQNLYEVLIPYNFEQGYFTGYQGLSSHGGAIGFVLSVIYYGKRKFNTPDILKILDLAFFYSLILIFLIRLGNLFNSEILGKYCIKFFCIVFPSYDNLPRYPAQIIEGLSYFFLFFMIYILKEKLRFLLKPGFLSLIIVFSVSFIRFFIEFIKLPNTQANTGILNIAQYLTIFICLIIGFIITTRKR
jgi:prolipoprotein diacylglyceryltransferase